jgi:hypothetical protein
MVARSTVTVARPANSSVTRPGSCQGNRSRVVPAASLAARPSVPSSSLIGPDCSQLVISARPLVTRAISLAAFGGSSLKITAKIDTTRSNESSSNGRSSAVAWTNVPSPTRCWATESRRGDGSTAVTSAPARAANRAALPVPVPRSRTVSPRVICARWTTCSAAAASSLAVSSYSPRSQSTMRGLYASSGDDLGDGGHTIHP